MLTIFPNSQSLFGWNSRALGKPGGRWQVPAYSTLVIEPRVLDVDASILRLSYIPSLGWWFLRFRNSALQRPQEGEEEGHPVVLCFEKMACILWLTLLFVLAALGVEARAVGMLSARSATDLYPQTPLQFLFWDRILPSCLGQLWISSGSQAGLAFAPVQPRAPEHLELQVCAIRLHIRHVYICVGPHPGPTHSTPWSHVLHWLPLASANSSQLCWCSSSISDTEHVLEWHLCLML